MKKLNLALLKRMYPFARPYWKWVALTLLTMILYSAAYQGRIMLIKPLFDKVLLKENYGYLVRLSWEALGLALCAALFDVAQEYLKQYTVLKILMDIRLTLFRHLLYLPFSFYSHRKSGDLVSRLTNDVATTRNALDFLFDDMLLQPCMILTAVGILLYLSWFLALFVLVGLPLVYFPIVKFARKIKKNRRKTLVSLGDMTEDIVESITGLKTIRAYQMESHQEKHFWNHNLTYLRKSLKVAWAKAMSSGLVELLYAVGLSGIFILGGYLVLKHKAGLTAGGLSAFLVALVALNKPVKTLTRSFNSFLESVAGFERIVELLAFPQEKEGEEEKVLPGLPLSGRLNSSTPGLPTANGRLLDCSTSGPPWSGKLIERGMDVDHLFFSYDGERPILQDVCFSVKFGQVLCMVGPSGAGKSTLVGLLARFYTPTQGKIFMDGVDVQTLPRRLFYPWVGILTAEPFLFHTSIRENLLYAKPTASLQELETACRRAYLSELIEKLPQRYESIVGPGGTSLSSGERQRLAIARAFLKDPHLLILDEPFSNLDVASEKYVEQAIFDLMKDRLTILVTHRLSCVPRADWILVLQDGKIVDQGKHDDLLERPGLYRHFLTQNGS